MGEIVSKYWNEAREVYGSPTRNNNVYPKKDTVNESVAQLVADDSDMPVLGCGDTPVTTANKKKAPKQTLLRSALDPRSPPPSGIGINRTPIILADEVEEDGSVVKGTDAAEEEDSFIARPTALHKLDPRSPCTQALQRTPIVTASCPLVDPRSPLVQGGLDRTPIIIRDEQN